MDKLRERYEAAGQAAIDSVKFTDDAVFEVSFGVVPDPQTGTPVMGTWLILALRHNILIGQTPVIVSIPVPSLNLGPEFLARAVADMLEQARQARDKMNAVPVQQVPAGLRGRKL